MYRVSVSLDCLCSEIDIRPVVISDCAGYITFQEQRAEHATKILFVSSPVMRNSLYFDFKHLTVRLFLKFVNEMHESWKTDSHFYVSTFCDTSS
jgi:hypothetical protein